MEPGQALGQVAKRRALILLIAALVAAILLAASLSNLELTAGQPFPGAGNASSNEVEAARPTAVAASDALPLVQGVLAAILLVLLILLLIRLVSMTTLRRVAGLGTALILTLILLISLPRFPGGKPISLPSESVKPGVPLTPVPTSPLGDPPEQLVWVVAVAVLLGAAVAVLTALRRHPRGASVSEQLQQAAERAVQAIDAGAEATNVVVRCYLEMLRIIQLERGVERTRNMTAREFEDFLEGRGLPSLPLMRLRSVFEDVRYGNRLITRDEEQLALDSLGDIAAFCRGSVH